MIIYNLEIRRRAIRPGLLQKAIFFVTRIRLINRAVYRTGFGNLGISQVENAAPVPADEVYPSGIIVG